MAENENIYGGLGQIGNFLTSLADRGLGAASATGLYGLGGASDLAGIIMDNLGLDDLALEIVFSISSVSELSNILVDAKTITPS